MVSGAVLFLAIWFLRLVGAVVGTIFAAVRIAKVPFRRVRY